MATVVDRPLETLADLLVRLGQIPLERIRFQPSPGTATEQDVMSIREREQRLCELVGGVLVEKAMGYEESLLAVFIARLLDEFVEPLNLGHVSGEGGMLRLFPGLVRIPDVAFASWDRFPNRRLTGDPIPQLVPDLAIEVLSLSNTAAEMTIKVDEYFSAGVQQVWLVDPRARTVMVFDAADHAITLREGDILDGGRLLPGFTLSLKALFARLDRHG